MDEQLVQVRRATARRKGRQWGVIALVVMIVLTVVDWNGEWSRGRIAARIVGIALVFPLAYGSAVLGERVTRGWWSTNR